MDVAIGMLRLKKSKDSEARRMLLRNSSTGKLVIVRLHPAIALPFLTRS